VSSSIKRDNSPELIDLSSYCDPHSRTTIQSNLSVNNDRNSVVHGEGLLPADNSVYATLSGSSDVLCLLSNDVPSPPSSTPSNVNECPEGILIDLGKNFFYLMLNYIL